RCSRASSRRPSSGATRAPSTASPPASRPARSRWTERPEPPASLDAVFLEPSVEGAAGHADGLRGFCAVPAGALERLDDALALFLLGRPERGGAGSDLAVARGWGGARIVGELEVAGLELGAVAEDPGVEQDVFELAHVARPAVACQALEG